MSLKINLFHEQERAADEAKRDPLKLAGFAAAGLAVLLAAYYAFVVGAAGAKAGELRELRTRWESSKPEAEAKANLENDLKNRYAAHERLLEVTENRIFWGPILERVLSVIQPSVQITEISGELQHEEAASKVVLRVSGISVGTEPRNTAEKLRTALEQQLSQIYPDTKASYVKLDDNSETLSIAGRQWRNSTFEIQAVMVSPRPVPPQ